MSNNESMLTSLRDEYIASIPDDVKDRKSLVSKITDIYDKVERAQKRNTVPDVLPEVMTDMIVLSDPPMSPEAELEEQLLKFLSDDKGFERLDINSEEGLVENLRSQISKFNNVSFNDSEWKRFLNDFAKKPKTPSERSELLYNGMTFTFDDGSASNIWFHSSDPSKNIFQVVHQMHGKDTNDKKTRYDVTILINGVPRVHFELKRPGVSITKAFGQIDRYVNTSFTNSDYNLYGFVSLFVISNKTNTRYYSNTTRNLTVRANERKAGGRSTKKKASKLWSNTFEWKTRNNIAVSDLISFADSFCDKRALSYIIADYCTLTVSQELFVAKPYQIAAAESMLNKTIDDFYSNTFNSRESNGYIWHATGSGKTFMSFLTAKLLANQLHIRTNFLVDRKDLDVQTIKEYNKFDPDSVKFNKNARAMRSKLADLDQTLVVGIINKMSRIVNKDQDQARKGKNGTLPAFYYLPTVFIFDECHRTQFGLMQVSIQKTFRRFVEFGITGTPIFEKNKHRGTASQTTTDIFGDCLHVYNLKSAMSDGNVLPYRVHIVPPELRTSVPPKEPSSKVYTSNPKRVMSNVGFILDHHNDLVMAKGSIQVPVADRKNAIGKPGQTKIATFEYRDHFNAILATDSCHMAATYYELLKAELARRNMDLNIAMIYTSPTIEEDDSTDDDLYSEHNMKKEDIDALARAIEDYNKKFSTSFLLSQDGFAKYYEHVAEHMKNADIDILIVVNMFLTGFDASCLNTLYLDKNLYYHNLIQAAGRGCRTCDTIKKWCELVAFRDIREDLKEAMMLYGGEGAYEECTIAPYNEILAEYIGAEEQMIQRANAILNNSYCTSADKLEYLKAFADAKQLRNKLVCYFGDGCDFDSDVAARGLLTANKWLDYQSRFVDIKEELDAILEHDEPNETDVILELPDDVVFVSEILDKYEITVEWLVKLIATYQEDPGVDTDKFDEIKKTVNKQFFSQPGHRLIEPWIEYLWTLEGSDEKEKYMLSEYENMLDGLTKKYDADRNGLANFVALSIREEEASGLGEPFANVFPGKGIKAMKARKAKKQPLLNDVNNEIKKWAQMEYVFVHGAPWRQ